MNSDPRMLPAFLNLGAISLACAVSLVAPLQSQQEATESQQKATDSQQEATEPKLGARLDAKNFEAWRDHIRVASGADAWKGLPWHMTFADGLKAAAKAEKPLLLWVMNGHPFGCT